MFERRLFLELLAGLGISFPHRFDTDHSGVSTTKLTQKRVKLLLLSEIESTTQSTTIVEHDSYYVAPKAIEPLLKLGQPVAELESGKEPVDCEDYAQLWASLQCFAHDINAVGWVIDDDATHAYNCVVTASEEVVWIEPQQNRVVELGEPLFGDSENGEYSMKSGAEIYI